MLEIAVLGLLKEQPLHGYELKKRLSETLGFLWGVSYGSLYPALRRLEREGAIEVVAQPVEPSTPFAATGSLKGDLAAARRAGTRTPKPSRRTRKAYRITERGNVRVVGEEELLEPDDAGLGDAVRLAGPAGRLRGTGARAPGRGEVALERAGGRTPKIENESPGALSLQAPYRGLERACHAVAHIGHRDVSDAGFEQTRDREAQSRPFPNHRSLHRVGSGLEDRHLDRGPGLAFEEPFALHHG